MMHQEVVYEPTPLKVDVDGVCCPRGVRYIGLAHRQPNGKYVALAQVGNALCWVETVLSLGPYAGAQK